MTYLPSSNDHDNADGSKGVRTVSDARRWLASLAQNGAADVRIKEPFQPVGGGLVIVQASLLRGEDGARINVAVYCFDDTPPPAVVDWLPPLPEEEGDGWFEDGGSFR